MRVIVSEEVRVKPGDEVVVRASLAPNSKLARLYMFARYHEDEKPSPYVPQLLARLAAAKPDVVNGNQPPLMTPMSIRLTTEQPARTVQLAADLDGWLCVMEEIDLLADPRARVKIRRRIDPALPWRQRLWRWAWE